MFRWTISLTILVAMLASSSELMAQRRQPLRNLAKNMGARWGPGQHWQNPGHDSSWYSPYSDNNNPGMQFQNGDIMQGEIYQGQSVIDGQIIESPSNDVAPQVPSEPLVPSSEPNTDEPENSASRILNRSIQQNSSTRFIQHPSQQIQGQHIRHQGQPTNQDWNRIPPTTNQNWQQHPSSQLSPSIQSSPTTQFRPTNQFRPTTQSNGITATISDNLKINQYLKPYQPNATIPQTPIQGSLNQLQINNPTPTTNTGWNQRYEQQFNNSQQFRNSRQQQYGN